MQATIQSVSTWPQPATVLTIDNVSLIPGASALYWWRLRTSSGAEMSSGTISLTGAAYSAWGLSDEYLFTYAAQQLGLTITAIVPDPPVASPI
jgi:hypothetical protein